MRILVTLLAALFIMSCAPVTPPVQRPGVNPVPPMPNFKHPRSHLEPTSQMRFSCPDTPDIMAGSLATFEGHIGDDHETMRYYTLWVFDTEDTILTENFPDGNIDNSWYDYGADFVPEYYFDDPFDVPGFPDICAGLEHLRKK